ncbi:MAG: hypothetical protein AAGA45_00800, partial [Verrucomicrobiota bacterium]
GDAVIGKIPYIWVLADITTFDQASVLSVAEHAIISDTTWQSGNSPGTIPAGSSPTPTLYSISEVAPNDIAFGTNVPNGGVGPGSSKILTAAIPEPSHYAVGFGMVTLLMVMLRRRRA